MERSRQWLSTFKKGMVKAVSEGRMDEAKEWARRYFDELMILVSVAGIDSKEDARMIVLFALGGRHGSERSVEQGEGEYQEG